MSSLLALTVYSGLILLASLAGGWLPQFIRLTHTRMQLATSFVAGLMLGVGLLHLLPHSWQALRSIDIAVWWLLGGFLVMFFIQRFFQFHHHELPGETGHVHANHEPEPYAKAHAPEGRLHHGHEHNHATGHNHLKLTWGGAALGLTLHTLIDGVALAASVQTGAQEPENSWLLGFSTFLVIILHKPFDAMAIVTLMAAGGWSPFARRWVNALFALAIPAGVLLFHFGNVQLAGQSDQLIGAALAFAAGTFLCIAASDLLPELQFHSHDRIKLSVALLLGLGLAILIGFFETAGHDHHHEHDERHDHDHAAMQMIGRL